MNVEKLAAEKYFISSIFKGKLYGAESIKQCLTKEPALF